MENGNGRNCFLESPVPEMTKKEPCMLGVDEAGRGPVLGPMVYGIFYCPVSHMQELKDIGCADSKTLTEEQREKLFDELSTRTDSEGQSFCGWMLEVHSPVTISNSMYRKCKYNLNALSQDSAATLIKKAIDAGVNVTEVYVDTVGPADKYEAKLSELFPMLKVKVSKQADSLFPVVSAASICAKVTRDRILKDWSFSEGDHFTGKDYGSGYPSDPVTKKFLSENIDPVFGYPQLVRFSWSTAEKILEDQAVQVLWDNEEEAGGEQEENYPSIMSYFARQPSSSAASKPSKHHSFFTDRCIQQVTSF